MSISYCCHHKLLPDLNNLHVCSRNKMTAMRFLAIWELKSPKSFARTGPRLRCCQDRFVWEVLGGKTHHLAVLHSSVTCAPWLMAPASVFLVYHSSLCFYCSITFCLSDPAASSQRCERTTPPLFKIKSSFVGYAQLSTSK